MNDMRAVIVPRSDQINADDLISGPMTITITNVTIKPGTEQPVSIEFGHPNGKVYRPCKSMARCMVHCWGPDANAYIGRSLTLYNDPSVRWGGMEVGGIRISHMSHIKGRQTMALTMTKGNKKPFTVQVLQAPAQQSAQPTQPVQPSVDAALLERATDAADKGMAAYQALWKALTKEEQAALVPEHPRLKKVAADVDANAAAAFNTTQQQESADAAE